MFSSFEFNIRFWFLKFQYNILNSFFLILKYVFYAAVHSSIIAGDAAAVAIKMLPTNEYANFNFFGGDILSYTVPTISIKKIHASNISSAEICK